MRHTVEHGSTLPGEAHVFISEDLLDSFERNMVGLHKLKASTPMDGWV
jgi:hypothetical protein